MLVTRRSMISGKVHTKDLDITEAQYNDWMGGTLLQYAFPQLDADDREFLKTGITKEEWDDAFGCEDEDPDLLGED